MGLLAVTGVRLPNDSKGRLLESMLLCRAGTEARVPELKLFVEGAHAPIDQAFALDVAPAAGDFSAFEPAA